MTTLEVIKKINIYDEDIDDIMVSALEGGINYWCAYVIVSEQISKGGSLTIVDEEGEEDQILTKEKFLKGCTEYFKLYAPSETLEKDKNHPDSFRMCPGEIDGNAADLIIQLALFDDVIYS